MIIFLSYEIHLSVIYIFGCYKQTIVYIFILYMNIYDICEKRLRIKHTYIYTYNR